MVDDRTHDRTPLCDNAADSNENESEIRELVWKALDGLADQATLKRLERLVLTQEAARRSFCEVLSLESSLREVC